MKILTLVKRMMFSIYTLEIVSKVINTKSWLEGTLDRKRKRKEDGFLNKDTLSLAIFS